MDDDASMARRAERPVALLLLDLDRFKEINDTFDHHHGAAVLRQVAQRLRAAVCASDTVARLGGDEFAVLLADCDAAAAVVSAGTMRAALEAPVTVEGQPLHLGASIGVVLYPITAPTL